MRNRFTVSLVPAALAALLAVFSGCAQQETAVKDTVHIGVFIPGVISGSPVYEMLAAGVKAAAEQYNLGLAEKGGTEKGGAGSVEVTIIEGGYNQAEWESKVTSMAAGGSYDLIVSSNPSLPDIVSGVSAKFPNQHFLLLDGELKGNRQVYTLRYNQREQAYMAGYIAALETEALAGSRRVGLVAAQEYPAMNNIILPGFLEGARAVNSAYTVDFRIVGNWYDAAKAAELAADMIRGGVKVILCISGGANEGVVQAASQGNARAVWFDTNGYNIRPGTVIGSSVLYQDLAAFHQITRYLEGTLPFGEAETLGVRDGYVDFIQDDPNYQAALPEEVKTRQAQMVERIRSGELVLE